MRPGEGIAARARSATRGRVFHEGELVGHLDIDRHRAIHFRYNAHWLDAPGAFPVSVHLPLSQGEARVNAHGFFEGLLPEGNPRRVMCSDLGLDADDDAALLFAIGQDCAGALSVLIEDERPGRTVDEPDPISREALASLVQRRGQPARGVSGAMRFSLAGAQHKVAVRIDAAAMFWPSAAHASTHILKFETIPHVCMSEYAGLRLAKACGLDVIEPELLTLGREAMPYLRLPRYDRERDADGVVWRIHQEDVIQALGYESRHKHEGEGGPGLGEVARLLREHTKQPIAAITALMRWQIFNYLIGNSDAHGKNLAFLYRRGEPGVSLAPFYDLVAIDTLNRLRAAGQRFARNMAFAIGGQMRPERVNRLAWAGFANDLGVRPRRVERELRDMALRLPGRALTVRTELDAALGERDVHRMLPRSIAERCAWTLRTLGMPARARDLVNAGTST